MVIERFDELFKILKIEYGDHLLSIHSHISKYDGVEDTPIIAIVPDFASVFAAKLEFNDFSFCVFPELEGHNLQIWIRDFKMILST